MTLNVILDLGPVLTSLGSKIVAALTDFTTKLDALDAKVSEIAAEIQGLKDQLAQGGLSADEEAQVLARLDTLTTALDAAK